MRRPLLPLLTSGPHGSRSAMTCHYRCGNACSHPVPNPTDNPTFRDIVEASLARRAVLRGGAVAAGMTLVGRGAAAAAAEGGGPQRMADVSGLRFRPVAPNVRDQVTVPLGFGHHVVVSWGSRILPDAPRFDVRNQSPESAAQQYGYNTDFLGVLPLSGKRALLVANHEYTNEELMFPQGHYDEDTIRRIAMASHGMSVLEIKRDSRASGAWRKVKVRKATHNRRITAHTPFRVTGPAAGHPRLRTSADPTGTHVLGTLNNCAGGVTPWGTVLSGEENFNQYFDASSGVLDERYVESYERYGIEATVDDGRGWRAVDSRFDLTQEPHEPFRFGWIVEVDPYRPNSTPRKRTMLGRFKHEGANIAIDRSGRVAAYMGDDERGDYLYKFVSRDRIDRSGTRAARRHNMTLLDHGTLYVARLTGDGEADGTYDGTGRWVRLTSDTESFVDGMSVAEVLIDTRLAADKVGPTKMDRPEDVQPNPVNGRIYASLTNNSERGVEYPVDEANPIGNSMIRETLDGPLVESPGNRNGYVLEISEDDDRHTARTFRWKLLLVCGDPEAPETYFSGYPKDQVSPISSPDNVAFDTEGNLWVSTDHNELGSNDGLFKVPVRGPERGHVQQFLTVPVGAECSGPFITADGRSVFVSVQHPGEDEGSTFENPLSTWPHTHAFPRPSVVVAYRP